MDETFLRYRDPAFRYAKSRNPARVRCRDDALRDGLNCVALAHLMIRDLFGYTLPAHLQALELVRDLEHFEPVPDPEHMQAGHLVWLGEHRPRADLRNPSAVTRVLAHRQARDQAPMPSALVL